MTAFPYDLISIIGLYLTLRKFDLTIKNESITQIHKEQKNFIRDYNLLYFGLMVINLKLLPKFVKLIIFKVN